MSSITKPRNGGGRRNRRNGGRRGGGGGGGGRRKPGMRTEAEQLDYEMELLKAQRDGREEEFKTEERAKLRARKAEELDAEMDEYFKKKDDPQPDKEAEKKDDADQAQPEGERTEKPVEENGQTEQPAQAAAN